MEEKLWSYRELKRAHIRGDFPPEKIAAELNEAFHNGESVRSGSDVVKLRSKKTILDR